MPRRRRLETFISRRKRTTNVEIIINKNHDKPKPATPSIGVANAVTTSTDKKRYRDDGIRPISDEYS